jgi:hypothetical protein
MVKSYLDDDDDDDAVLRDGESVRVPVFLADAVTPEFAFDPSDHQPGFRGGVTDAAQDARLQDARTAARNARSEMIDRLVNAWRRPSVRDAAEPDMNSPPAAMRLRGPEGGPDEDNGNGNGDNNDAQRRRDQAYRTHVDQISNAWRTAIVGAGPGALGASPTCIGPGPRR